MATAVQISNLALRHLGSGVSITSLTQSIVEARILNDFYDLARQEVLRDGRWPFAIRIAVTADEVENDPNDEWDRAIRYPSDCLRILRVFSGSVNETRQNTIQYRIVRDDELTISSITQANPAVVTTSVAHNYATGDTVYLDGVDDSMTQLTDGTRTITVTSTTQFSLDGINSSAYTAYTSGGTSRGRDIILTNEDDAELEYIADVDTPGFYPPDFVMALSYRLAAYSAPVLFKGDFKRQEELMLKMYVMSYQKALANAQNEERLPEMPDSEFISGR